MVIIFLIREQINVVEFRLALFLNTALLTLIPTSNEIDEEDKFGFYHLSHTHSWKTEVENTYGFTLFLVHNPLQEFFPPLHFQVHHASNISLRPHTVEKTTPQIQRITPVSKHSHLFFGFQPLTPNNIVLSCAVFVQKYCSLNSKKNSQQWDHEEWGTVALPFRNQGICNFEHRSGGTLVSSAD